MKVYDLISILERLDPQADVTVWNDSDGGFRTKDIVLSKHHDGNIHLDYVLMGEELKVE